MFKKILATMLALITAVSFAAVDINKATPADLDSIKGIGPSTSTRILDERKASPFKDWADLIRRVPGIGGKRAAKLSDQALTVNRDTFKRRNANLLESTRKKKKTAASK